MTPGADNIHATAIVVGTTGLLFLGASGSGKSSMAFACIAEAEMFGLSAALVADDQVLVTRQGDKILAACPPSIAGLIEIRSTGILRLPYVSPVRMDYAVLPVDPTTAERLPDENEVVDIHEGMPLPAIRIADNARFPLAILRARIPALRP